MECARCRHESPAGAKFCAECGAPMALDCARCRTRLPPQAKFCPECAHPVGTPAPAAETRFVSPADYTPKHIAEKILGSRGALQGERKQVTVLFADLKGSMELLADRDAEDAGRVLDGVLERMMEAIHHYEGTVNQVMGDGIMALFGAPIAHEDHAVRACFAALRMQARVADYAEELHRTLAVPVHIRVGLNAGEVVVRSIGNDLHMDYTAVGQTTHLAARMEQMAMPGSILMPSDTLALVDGCLVLESTSVSYGRATAFLPVIDLLRAYFRIDHHDEPRAMQEKVTGKLLTLDENLGGALPALLSLLGVPVSDRAWEALGAAERRQRTLDAIKHLVLRESQVQPVVLVFEDLHWIDSETQSLLDSLVESLPTARILQLVNYRPEYQHGWGGKTY